MRKVYRWNENWEFVKGERLEDKAWESVTLPHTWNAIDGQDGGNDYYQGVSWYKKVLSFQNEWKEVYIRFGAVNKKAEVWCNGELAGEHTGGFSAFAINLTPYLKSGENEILIKANNSNDIATYPKHADFTFFGGIYRDVELICFDSESHFDVTRFGTDAILITPETNGTVFIDTYIESGKSVYAEIYDSSDELVSKSDVLDIDEKHTVQQAVRLTLKIPEVFYWNGTKDAYLYKAKVFLSDKDVQDVIEDKFGFRDFSVSASDGFFLNGASYPLRGVCRHQDREDMGWAITEKEHIKDMALIRDIGANTIRLAHYQQAPYFYDLCDSNGMVVWAEIPFISVYDDCRESDDNLKQQMKELVLQNYNHPSICFWGIANEVGIAGESQPMYHILKELNQLTKELDPTRLTAIANVGMTKTTSPLFHITDVTSYNVYKGWYEGKMDDLGIFCDERHSEIPEIPLAISEYGAESVLNWHSEQPKVKDYSEEYQALLHEKAIETFDKRNFIWATWLWNMFDFASDARDEGGCKGRNNKGLVTFDRKVKKQAFYLYKARWSKEPFVYLCGKRFAKRSQDKIDIKVYSNQEKVDLWVNGEYKESLQGTTVFEFKEIALPEKFNEILVRTPNGLMDTLVFEKVDKVPDEYMYVEEKNISDAVKNWFEDLMADNTAEVGEIVIREGYLSVNDPMEEIYEYPEGYKAVQELIAAPMALNNPAMAGRMSKGGVLSFTSIWNHISKYMPDEAYYLLNERLNKIKKS